MKTGACLRCARSLPMANLIVTASGVTVCPECRYARDAYAITHQVLAPAPIETPPAPSLADELVGGTVIELPVHRPRPRPKRRSA